jgi:zinc transport system substrate-binding protein
MDNRFAPKRFFGIAWLLFLLLIFSACSRQADIAHNREKAGDASRPLLALSILPQMWFAQRLAGDRVRTLVLVGPGQNPHK